MRKPRSSYTDHTRKLRSGRRTAILNAAAVRMGYRSWQKFNTFVREALETAETDHEAADNMRNLLYAAERAIKDGPDNLPPADVQAVLAAFPPRKSGRPKIAKK
jgi:hypothetical protein